MRRMIRTLTLPLARLIANRLRAVKNFPRCHFKAGECVVDGVAVLPTDDSNVARAMLAKCPCPRGNAPMAGCPYSTFEAAEIVELEGGGAAVGVDEADSVLMTELSVAERALIGPVLPSEIRRDDGPVIAMVGGGK